MSEETEFLAAYDPSRFPRVAVTVDVVALTIRDGRLCVLLIERGGPPFAGRSRNDRRAPSETVATSGSRSTLRTVSACQATASDPSR